MKCIRAIPSMLFENRIMQKGLTKTTLTTLWAALTKSFFCSDNGGHKMEMDRARTL